MGLKYALKEIHYNIRKKVRRNIFKNSVFNSLLKKELYQSHLCRDCFIRCVGNIFARCVDLIDFIAEVVLEFSVGGCS